jgi:hypothetical protein
MSTSKVYYFYLWRHRFVDDATDQIIARTCFGITSDPTKRIHGYEGHVGHVVKFAKLWTGSERLIRELEARIKTDFFQYTVVGTDGFRYEWINEAVEFDSIVKWVNWEIENTFIGVTLVDENLLSYTL